MHLKEVKNWQAYASLALALACWTAIFGLKLINFWLGMSLAALGLTLLSVFWAGLPIKRREINLKNTAVGLASAALLYGIFALGRHVSLAILPFASEQIGSIYTIEHQADRLIIALVLLFLTSPCEEIFWRGFLQRWSVKRFGSVRGLLLASLCYAAVHLTSGNFMLMGAALTAGLFWGSMYQRTGSLYTCIVSHAVWTVGIFLLFPMP